jgi:hypothetical protein
MRIGALAHDHRIHVKVIDYLNSAVVGIKPVAKNFKNFALGREDIATLVPLSDLIEADNELISPFAILLHGSVNDGDITILLEAIHRARGKVVSSELIAEVDFGLETFDNWLDAYYCGVVVVNNLNMDAMVMG